MEKQMIITGVKYKKDTTNLLKEMTLSMKKVAGELKSLGRGSGGKISVEEIEALAAENAEAFAAAGFKSKQKGRRRSVSDSELMKGSNPVKEGRRLT